MNRHAGLDQAKERTKEMARQIEDEVNYYYDSHPTEEDLMGETSFHAELVIYLMEVLRWLFRGQVCAIYDNLNFYQTDNAKEYPIAPDIAIIKDVSQQPARSWRVGKRGPAPHVVFEVGSEETWRKDLLEKPRKYASMGAQEYFAYDPNDILLPASKGRRLFGWRLDPTSHTMKEIQPRSDGALWSRHLESWLVPDGTMLRLYDVVGQMRLTGMEAEAQQRQLEAQQREAEARRADAAIQQAEFEAMRAQAEAQRAEAAIQQAEIESRRASEAIQQAQAFAEKLRSLGIDPDQLI